MKWMTLGLAAALVLIAAGVLLNERRPDGRLSGNSEALALCEEGTADQQAFRMQAAVDKLGRALELDPSLAEAAIGRTFAWIGLGRTEEYERELARADSLVGALGDPQRRMIDQLRMAALRDSRFHAMRDSLLARLTAELPDNLYVLVAQSQVTNERGDLDETERLYRRTLEIDPNFANSYNMLGYLELSRGNYDQAIEHMQKYAFLAPGLANPHDSLGDVLMVLGRYEEAEKEYRTAIKIQPDFYASIINLGRTYLARGQLKKGMTILQSVREQVAGSSIEQRVDREILQTYLAAELNQEFAHMVRVYVERYPDEDNGQYFQAISLAHQGQLKTSRALMDSLLTQWRISDVYRESPSMRMSVESASQRYEALVADIADDPATRVRLWENAVDLVADKRSFNEQWFDRYRLATAYYDAGRTAESLAVLEPMIGVNPRLVYCLGLAVKCHLAQGEAEPARRLLEQLRWSLAKADPEFPAVAQAAALAPLVAGLEKGS